MKLQIMNVNGQFAWGAGFLTGATVTLLVVALHACTPPPVGPTATPTPTPYPKVVDDWSIVESETGWCYEVMERRYDGRPIGLMQGRSLSCLERARDVPSGVETDEPRRLKREAGE